VRGRGVLLTVHPI